MFTKEENNIKNYVVNPFEKMTSNHDDEYESTCIEYEIFEKKIRMTYDPLIHHIHLKINDACNGNCPFCIERGRNLVEEDKDLYLKRLDAIFQEFKKAGLIYSVSITGGEPLLSNKILDILDIIDKYDFKMVTMNTNGSFLNKYALQLARHNIYGINISRHHYDEEKNNEIFGFKTVFTNAELIEAIEKYRTVNKNTKFRLQCILVNGYIDSLEKINAFVDCFKDVIDDFSFRQQMTVNDDFDQQTVGFFQNTYVPLQPIINQIYQDSDNYEFIYQRIVDYYCYEGWKNKNNGKEICFSSSNMELLSNAEKTEDPNLIREFIYYYNGRLAGSWLEENKTIIEPFQKAKKL